MRVMLVLVQQLESPGSKETSMSAVSEFYEKPQRCVCLQRAPGGFLASYWMLGCFRSLGYIQTQRGRPSISRAVVLPI